MSIWSFIGHVNKALNLGLIPALLRTAITSGAVSVSPLLLWPLSVYLALQKQSQSLIKFCRQPISAAQQTEFCERPISAAENILLQQDDHMS